MRLVCPSLLQELHCSSFALSSLILRRPFVKRHPIKKTVVIQMVGTCAIVGSSGSLLFAPARGNEINKADFVVRFNDAPVKGFEAFVGNRTDFRVFNSYAIGKVMKTCAESSNEPWTKLLATNPSHTFACSRFKNFPKHNECCPKEYMILNTWSAKYASCIHNLCPRSARALLLAVHNSNTRSLFSAIKAKGKSNWMSGSLAVLAMSKWCQKRTTNFYGFDLKDEFAYHYYESCRKANVDLHSDYRKQLEESLRAYNQVHFHTTHANATRLLLQPSFERDICYDHTIRQCGGKCPSSPLLHLPLDKLKFRQQNKLKLRQQKPKTQKLLQD